jgi:hypothetical protein
MKTRSRLATILAVAALTMAAREVFANTRTFYIPSTACQPLSTSVFDYNNCLGHYQTGAAPNGQSGCPTQLTTRCPIADYWDSVSSTGVTVAAVAVYITSTVQTSLSCTLHEYTDNAGDWTAPVTHSATIPAGGGSTWVNFSGSELANFTYGGGFLFADCTFPTGNTPYIVGVAASLNY